MKAEALGWVASGLLAAGLLLGFLAEDMKHEERREVSEPPKPPKGPCAPCMAARLARAEREAAERLAAEQAATVPLSTWADLAEPDGLLNRFQAAGLVAEHQDAEQLAERLAAGRERMADQEAERMAPRTAEGIVEAALKWAEPFPVQFPVSE